jgi:peroxiredoxin
MRGLLGTILAALALASTATAAEDLQATVRVTGRKVVVRVRLPNGDPAAGVPVRLLYGRQFTVAVAHTNDDGVWNHTVSRSGAYDVMVGTGTGEAKPVQLPFTVLDSGDPSSLAWLLAGPGIGCFIWGLLLIVDRRRNATKPWPRVALGATVLLAVGAALVGLSAWTHMHEPTAGENDGPDVAHEARAFLRRLDVKPLSGPLQELLADPAGERVKTQPHPLLGQPAPDFQLADHRGQGWRLGAKVNRGPVVLTFYFGYHCNHCVGQLFALHDDIEKFRELGAQVVAISADPPDLTRQRFKQYGEFAFPVLADPGNSVAQKYQVFTPGCGDKREDLLHATFIIGRDGRVHWAYTGNEPFTSNLTLLTELARLEGRLPVAKP